MLNSWFKVWEDVRRLKQTSGNSLSLLIVLRYSTVVVLVVVVVVLEVVSASSKQRPVSQSVQLWLFNIFALRPTNWPAVAALQFRYEPLRFDSFRLWGCLIYIYKKKRRKCTRRKMISIHLHTREKRKVHIHTTRPLWSHSESILRASPPDSVVWKCPVLERAGGISPFTCVCLCVQQGYTGHSSIHPFIHSSLSPCHLLTTGFSFKK